MRCCALVPGRKRRVRPAAQRQPVCQWLLLPPQPPIHTREHTGACLPPFTHSAQYQEHALTCP